MDRKILEDGNERILRMMTEPDTEHVYELRMISHSHPRELLPVRISGEQGLSACDYNITGLASLKDCEGQDAADYLYSVVFALERLGETLGEHLLSPDRVLLDPETIFLKKETGTVSFCYFPGKKGGFQDSLQALMEYFLKIIEPLGEAEVLLLYGLYQKSREPNVRPGTLADFWRDTRGNAPIPEDDTLTLAPRGAGAPALSSRDDPAVFRDLGLEDSTVSRPFLKWRSRQEAVFEDVEDIQESPSAPETATDGEVIRRQPDVRRFFKKNVIEIAATVIVAAGLVMYFVR